MAKTACIFGSTGLIGNYLLSELLKDSRYDNIIVFVRKEIELSHPKLKVIIGDYGHLESYSNELFADEYYCCLGTTMKKAKTKEAFEYVDYQLPLKIAKAAQKLEIDKLCVVSSIGASAKSNNFYLRTKGKMEEAISGLGIRYFYFFRPSLLLGDRKERRFGESIAKVLSKMFGFLMLGGLRKYKAIHGVTVAKAMIKVTNSTFDKKNYISDEIQKLGS